MSTTTRTEEHTTTSLYWREAERVAAARDYATDGGNLHHAAALEARRVTLVAAITRRLPEGGAR